MTAPLVLRDAIHALLWSRHPIVTVGRLSDLLGLHERTLRKRFQKEQLPNPQWLIGWSRLLVAAWMLSDQSRTVDDVSRVLDYSTPSSFRGTFKRYTGTTASEARVADPIGVVALAMRRAYGVESN